jgi:hypothetical protein
MAVDIIQLPGDGAGKRIHALSFTSTYSGTPTVYLQGGFLSTDTAAGNPAVVAAAPPAAADYGLGVRQLMEGAASTASWASATTLNTALSVAVTNYSSAIVSFDGSTGTVSGGQATFEGSTDGGATWMTIPGAIMSTQPAGSTTSTTVNFTATISGYIVSLIGLTNFRVRLSTVITSGTEAIRIIPSTVPGPVALSVSLGAQSGGNVVGGVQISDRIADNAAFTDGTSGVIPSGYILDETAGTALTENDVGAARMDSKRAVVSVIEDATTRGTRAAVNPVLAPTDSSGLVTRSVGDNVATVFYDQIEGSALNTNLWTGANTTMTIAQAGGLITLNNGAITTTTTNASISSVKNLPRFGYFPLIARMAVKMTNPTATNQTMEFGFGVISGATAPTDGAYFRQDSTGLKAVITFNGTDTVSSAISGYTAGNVQVFEVHMIGRKAIFVLDGTVVATLTATATNIAITSVDRMPVFARVKNTGAASAAPQLGVARVSILQTDLDWGKSWGDEISDSQAKGSYQSPVTTFGQTANWTNSAAGTTRTLSNTAAAEATLGGLVYFTPTYTATTDVIFIGYQVPAGYEFHVTSINITGPYYLSGTAAATATTLIWGIAVGSSAVSLATADALGPPPTTWAPRRTVIGATTLAASPAATTIPSPVNLQWTWNTPMIVDSGRFFHVLARPVITRTAGASEVHYVGISVNGYFE